MVYDVKWCRMLSGIGFRILDILGWPLTELACSKFSIIQLDLAIPTLPSLRSLGTVSD